MTRCIHLSDASYRTLGWPKIKPSAEGFVFWHIVNFTKHMPKEKTIEAFEDVFSIWQLAFDEIEPQGRAIEFRSTSSFEEAHIKIYFVKPGRNLQVIECSDGRSRAVKIPSQFDGPGGVLAYVPYGTHEVFFDEGEKWSEMTRMKHGEIRLIDVALHEVGHTLDLGHSEVKNALMGAYYDGTEKLITDDDLAGISVVWGKLKSELMSKGVAAMALAPDERPDPSTVIVMGILEYYGMKEIPGRESNQKLLAIMRKYISWVEDDSELAWCSIMLDYIAKKNGIQRPNSPAAVDWRKVGTAVDLDDVKIGDVMIFYRTKESDWRGHVGVFISHSEHKGYVWLLGGNQSNQVNIQHQSLAKLRKNGIRRLSYEK